MYIYDGKNDIQAIPTTHTAALVCIGKCSSYKSDFTTVRKNGRINWSLFYCERGKIHIDGVELPAGAVWIYPPSTPQRYTIYQCDRTKYRYLHFNGQCMEELLAELNISLQTPIKGNRDVLLPLFDSIEEEAQTITPISRLRAEYHILQLLSHLAPKDLTNRSIGIMHRITDEMEHNFYQEYDAQKYAAMLHVSISRFQHLFKDEVGVPPHAYYQRLRMENACDLLRGSCLKINEVAQSCGFEDALYFTQAFKKHTGMPPSHYRKAAKND